MEANVLICDIRRISYEATFLFWLCLDDDDVLAERYSTLRQPFQEPMVMFYHSSDAIQKPTFTTKQVAEENFAFPVTMALQSVK